MQDPRKVDVIDLLSSFWIFAAVWRSNVTLLRRDAALTQCPGTSMVVAS